MQRSRSPATAIAAIAHGPEEAMMDLSLVLLSVLFGVGLAAAIWLCVDTAARDGDDDEPSD